MIVYTKAPSGTPEKEQEVIADFFKGYSTGYFLDIGAFDGVAYSNTRGLWEKGWSGVLVEPDPDTFIKLESNYPNRDRVTLVNAAVALENGLSMFSQHADQDRSGWHSMYHNWIATWQPGKERRIRVRTITFEMIPLTQPIDFLSVDTEGMDAIIITSMPETVRPKLIMAETDKYPVREKLDAEMERRGYDFIWGTYLNSAYALRNL